MKAPRVGLLDLVAAFAQLGAASFGGGLAPFIRQMVVYRRRWMDDHEFLRGLEITQMLPGSNAINLTVYVGQRFQGTAGGLLSVAALAVPGVVALLALGFLYFDRGYLPAARSFLAGVGAAAVGLALANVIQVGRRGITTLSGVLLMLATFAAIGLLRLPLAPVLAALGGLGVWLHWPRDARGRRLPAGRGEVRP